MSLPDFTTHRAGPASDRRSFLRYAALAAGLPLFAPVLPGWGQERHDARNGPGAAGLRDGVADDATLRVSLPGTYGGYSHGIADGFSRSSRYVAVRDGTRIALDIYRPTLAGGFLDGALPLVAISTGYRRAWIMSDRESPLVRRRWPGRQAGEFASQAVRAARLPDRRTAIWPEAARKLAPAQLADWLLDNGSVCEYLLVHGYNIAVIDTRGTGASFGAATGGSALQIGQDLDDLFEWFAARPWCDGSIGMIGASWHGAVQHMALSYGVRRLKAVMPQMTPIDQYLGLWPGGIYNIGLMRDWFELRAGQDRLTELSALPVDEDPDGRQLAAAMDARRARDGTNADPVEIRDRIDQQNAAMAGLTRDRFQLGQGLLDVPLGDGTRGNLAQAPLDFARANLGQTAVYSWNGWWDIYAREGPMAHANLTTPRKLLMGPWNHGNYWDTGEALRWFDYWLKGIDNGIMDEPPVAFATAQPDAPPKWRHGETFPPAGVRTLDLALTAGGLMTADPTPSGAFLSLETDYSATSGPGARAWGFSLDARLDYSALHDATGKGLVFESAPLGEPLDICGYPALRLRLSSSTDEARVFAFLRDIAPDGRAHCIAEGCFDYRFRTPAAPPYDTLGTAWYSFAAADMLPVVPGEPMEATIDLTPIAWLAPAGHRLQLILTGADRDNAYQAPADTPPVLSIRCGGEEGAALRLPVLAPSDAPPAIDGAFAGLSEESTIGVKAG